MKLITITNVVCHKDVSPCYDRIDDVPARPDGVHYEDAGEKKAVHAILERLAPIIKHMKT